MMQETAICAKHYDYSIAIELLMRRPASDWRYRHTWRGGFWSAAENLCDEFALLGRRAVTRTKKIFALKLAR
jgi:hypothetical protein